MREQLLLLFALAAAVPACSAQHRNDYRGEPLAELHGTVSSTSTAPLPPLDVALVWDEISIGGPNGVLTPLNVPEATRIPVSGQFPSAFTVDLMTTPPEEVLISCSTHDHPNDTGHFGFAHIRAVAQGSSGGEADTYGDAFGFQIIYADQDIAACEWLSELTAVPVSKGYHLVRRVEGPCARDLTGDVSSCGPWADVPSATPIDLPVLDHPLQPPLRLAGDGVTAGPNCLYDTPPSSGLSSCRLFFVLLYDSTFDCTTPGWADASAFDTARMLPDFAPSMTVCGVAQVPPSAWVDDSCAQSSQPGWCYVTGAGAGSCAQGALFFSSAGAPPAAAASPPYWSASFVCP
jgi:hypothetical protein